MSITYFKVSKASDSLSFAFTCLLLTLVVLLLLHRASVSDSLSHPIPVRTVGREIDTVK